MSTDRPTDIRMSDEETIRAALVRAKEKLKAYFDETKGSYPGGPPYLNVMKEADAALIALTRLVAERDAAEAKGWNDAIEAAKTFVLSYSNLYDLRDANGKRILPQTEPLRSMPMPTSHAAWCLISAANALSNALRKETQ